MPDCRVGHVAETPKFERFQKENPPPYGPFYNRYVFGVKTTVKGKQYGITCSSTHEPNEILFRKLEQEVLNIIDRHDAPVL